MGAPDEQLPARFGPFVLLRLLGVGGMGKVYFARHPVWKLRLVVKRMHPQFMDDQTIFKRFVHEAQVATYVRQRNVATMIAMGTVGREPFFATEFVFGIPVTGIIERIESSKTPKIPLGVGLKIGIGILAGLEAVHEARDTNTGAALGLIHRDIGSRNILVGFDGVPRIIDLGLGKSILADWQTAADVFAGSPDYMPPEQAVGERCDARADVYAAAVTIWELLAGVKRIREPQVAQRIVRAIEAQPETLRDRRPDAPASLERALMHAMAPRRDDRTPTARLFREALEREMEAIAPGTRSGDVVQWLEVACATVIAKERRLLDDAEALLPPEEQDQHEATQILAAQPAVVLHAMPRGDIAGETGHAPQPRGDTELEEPTPPASPVPSRNEATIVPGARPGAAGVARTGAVAALAKGFLGLAFPVQVGLTVLAGALLALLFTIAVLPGVRDDSFSVAPMTLPPEPAPPEPALPPSERAEAPPEPAVEAEEEEEGPGPETETPPKEAPPARDAPEVAARKRELVRRLRDLRKVRFDIAWQRRITELGTKLSRTRSMRGLDEVESAIVRLEKQS